ncbi:hypothetical protein GQ600_17930 [Phytophthora cactorum]|nr:hypothetical protein GQ600_17930 [Phytophthora cactorum]
MHSQRRPAPESTYASQAARWKQGFKTPAQQQPAQHQTDLENALVSELCSSVGSSSFPPREVLQKLLRYLHTLDHDYICELLDDKFESPLWQWRGRVLQTVLQWTPGLTEDLRNARKDMLRKRADKVYALLKDYVRRTRNSVGVMRRMQEEEAEEADARAAPDSSAPLPGPAVQEGSAFSFLAAQPTQQEYAPAEMAAEPMTPPVSNSGFGFLSLTNANPEPSAPPLSSDSASFGFLNQASTANSVHASEHGIPSPSTAEIPSAFTFMGGRAAPATKRGAAAAPTQAAPAPRKKRKKEEELEMSDPIHDAFEGMDVNDGTQALESFDAYKPSSDAVHGGYEDASEPTQPTEPLREVILEIDVPPGPMGVMLDEQFLT